MLTRFLLSSALVQRCPTLASSGPAILRKEPLYRALSSSLLYVDKGAAVVNKPPGLICQLNHSKDPKAHDGPESAEFRGLLTEIQTTLGLPDLPYHLHRLDKSTTGTLAIALNRQTAQDLSRQIHDRLLDKTYLAVVRGGDRSFPDRQGVISNFLRCELDGSVSVATSPKTKSKSDKVKWINSAESEWELLASSPSVPLSLVKLKLRTGLKHQLRVHLAQVLGAPILGEMRYAKPRLSDKITKVVQIPPEYLYLHASSISFTRYFPKQTRVKVVAPLPGYFTKLCAKVGVHIPSEFTKAGVWKDGVEVKNVIRDFLSRHQVASK